jgi:ABC-type phosphonate transport system ATPase subunit
MQKAKRREEKKEEKETRERERERERTDDREPRALSGNANARAFIARNASRLIVSKLKVSIPDIDIASIRYVVSASRCTRRRNF